MRSELLWLGGEAEDHGAMPVQAHGHLVDAEACREAQVNCVVLVDFEVEVGRGEEQVRVSVEVAFYLFASAEKVLPECVGAWRFLGVLARLVSSQLSVK